MKKETLQIIVGGLFGITLGHFAYKIYRANQEKKKAQLGKSLEVGKTEGTIDENTQSSIGAKESRDSFPLKIGSYGFRVSLLQSALNKLGASLTIDGKFGAKTYDAIGEHGGLSWYEWSACRVGYWCGLDKDQYKDILNNASNEGWSKEQAEGVASADWKEFAMSGDDWVYNNLRV